MWKNKKGKKVIVFSNSWPIREYISSIVYINYDIELLKVDNFNTLIDIVQSGDVIYIVLDISPRNHIGLLCSLRMIDNHVPIIITSDRFLLSDRVACEFFGCMINVELKSFLDIPPGKSPSQYFESDGFSGPFFYGKKHAIYKNIDEVISLLNKKLDLRLRNILNSEKAYEVAIKTVALEGNTNGVVKLLGLSNKSVYNYRYVVMRKISVNHYAQEFIQSLTFNV